MKKLLLLVFAMCLSGTFAFSQVQYVMDFPVTVGSGIDLQKIKEFQQTSVKYQVPYLKYEKNALSKLMFADNLQDEPVAFPTRLHPYPTDNSTDTSRYIVNVLDPTNDADFIAIGDTWMPQAVGDGKGNIVFKLNAYMQVIPSLSWYIPSLYNGTMTIDSVVFLIYADPTKPVTHGYYFSMAKVNNFNLPNFGTTSFDPTALNKIPFDDVLNNLEGASVLEPTYLNNVVKNNLITPTTVDFSVSELATQRTYKNDDRMMLMIWKEDMSDLNDQTDLLGGWEWGLPYNQTFAASVKHYDDLSKKDSLIFFSELIPGKPTDGATKYPTYYNETHVRKDYRFIVYGRYTGEYNPNSVKEVDKYSETFELSQNSPNPVSSTTTINFTIKTSNFVTLKVYNQIGEEVASLVSKFMTPGTYEASFDASTIPSGTYFYTLSTENFTKTLPMIIVK